MALIELWHNPRCSKSRAAKDLVEQSGHVCVVYAYLDERPDEGRINEVLRKLQIGAHALVRTKESAYAEHNLSETSSESALLSAMSQSPVLIERPILVCGKRAVVGRPTEAVESFLASLEA